MASTVASPTLLYPRNGPGPTQAQGILLNPYVNSSGRSPRYGHNASLPLPPRSEPRISAASSPSVRGPSLPLPRTDSGSSTNSTDNNNTIPRAHSRANSIRKIRFAPLPVPRDLEDAEFAQMESPIPAMNEDEGVPMTPGSTASRASNGSTSSAGILGLFSTNPDDNNMDTASEAGGGGAIKTIAGITFGTKSKSKHWSKRLLKPLLKATDPEKCGSTSDDALWRSPSRDSNTSPESSPQMRRMPIDTRTRHSSIGGSVPPARVHNPRRQKMLNGRMYGVKRNGFQNIQDEEPAFVEWGHGGAGSVNNRHGAGSSKYAGVQSGQKVSIGAVASPSNSVAGGDEDDGSGMAWLKRRREQRERERLEQEEREREKARTDTTTMSEESERDVLEMVQSPGAVDVTAGGIPSEVPEEHRIVTAIQVPAPPHVHGHGHPQTHTHVPSHTAVEKPAEPSTQSNQSSSGSSEEDEDESETEGDDGEDDEDADEDDEEDDRRKTALCAGVEKVSRHKEE